MHLDLLRREVRGIGRQIGQQIVIPDAEAFLQIRN